MMIRNVVKGTFAACAVLIGIGAASVGDAWASARVSGTVELEINFGLDAALSWNGDSRPAVERDGQTNRVVAFDLVTDLSLVDVDAVEGTLSLDDSRLFFSRIPGGSAPRETVEFTALSFDLSQGVLSASVGGDRFDLATFEVPANFFDLETMVIELTATTDAGRILAALLQEDISGQTFGYFNLDEVAVFGVPLPMGAVLFVPALAGLFGARRLAS